MADRGLDPVARVREAVEGDLLTPLFAGDAFGGLFAWAASRGYIETFANGDPSVPGVPVEILWFLGLAAVATWILLRTTAGNWIFAAGGDANAAANSGVPVRRVKISLFMVTAACAALLAIMQVSTPGPPMRAGAFRRNLRRSLRR